MNELTKRFFYQEFVNRALECDCPDVEELFRISAKMTIDDILKGNSDIETRSLVTLRLQSARSFGTGSPTWPMPFGICHREDFQMTRPPRLFAVSLAVVLLLALWHTLAQSQNRQLDQLKQRLNNISHENAVCGVYYALVSVCIVKDHPNDPTAAQYMNASRIFFDRSIQTGRVAGVSDKALQARTEMATDEMKAEIEDNCSNISILLKKHAMACKKLFEEGPAQLEKLMN